MKDSVNEVKHCGSANLCSRENPLVRLQYAIPIVAVYDW